MERFRAASCAVGVVVCLIACGGTGRQMPGKSSSPLPNAAIVGTEGGLVEWRFDGTTRVLTTQPVEWCVADPYLGAVWFGHHDGERGHIYMADPDGTYELVVSGPWATGAVIDYGAQRSLGRPHAVHYTVMPAVVLREGRPPSLNADIGCSGDQSWFCYEDVGHFEEEPALTEELAGLVQRINATKIPVTPLLKARRGAAKGRPLPADGPARAEPYQIGGLDTDDCAEPDLCGTGTPIPGTPWLLATVHNDRGDFYAATQQFYDPVTKDYFDPARPSVRSKNPLVDAEHSLLSVDSGMLSHDAAYLLTHHGLISTARGLIHQASATTLCGFWRGGQRLATW